MLPDDLVTPKAAAKLLKCHIASIYRWILAGRLRAWKRLGGRYLVSKADVEALLTPVEGCARVEVPGALSEAEVARRYARAMAELRGKGFSV